MEGRLEGGQREEVSSVQSFWMDGWMGMFSRRIRGWQARFHCQLTVGKGGACGLDPRRIGHCVDGNRKVKTIDDEHDDGDDDRNLWA